MLLEATCCRQQNCCQFVARLLLDTKGYMLPIYRQHVAGNKQHVAGQHIAVNIYVARQHDARPGKLPWCKRGLKGL